MKEMTKVKLLIDDAVVYEYDDTPKSTYGKKIFDGFDANRNILEYNGIVGDIQKWYYDSSSVVKAPWCATSMSYFANRAGCLDRIGGKNENVCAMMKACERAAKDGKGTFYDREHLPDTIPQYAVLFWLWDGKMSEDNPQKHVGLSEYAATGSTVYCIGGNQSDKICTKAYDRKYLYAIYLINS